MRNFFTLTGFFLIQSVLLNLYAQTASKNTIADQVFSQNQKEVYFSFTIQDKAELNVLTKVISIDHLSPEQIQNKEVRAYANKKQFTNFLAYNYAYQILPSPASVSQFTMLADGAPVSNLRVFGTYPTYSQYVGFMQQFAIDYPTICKLYNIGATPNGHALYVMKITDNINADENEPEFLYTSSMHGDEIAGYPMMLSLIEHLLMNYGTNADVTNLVNNVEIWINPNANPDGTYMGGDNTVSGAIRYNSNGIDLNRNYPDPENGLHPDGEVWQPETVAFMGFADTMDFVMAANFHGGAEVTNYLWDTWNHVSPDLDWWVNECVRWADSAQAVAPAGYMDDLYGSSTNPGVTNGYDWYEVDGGRQDYMNWWHNCREMTVELSNIKILPAGQLADHWNYNRGALLNFMEQSLYGIRGIVTDACTGLPVKAKVFVNAHDFDSSHVYSSLPVGNYHRPIEPGTYSVTFSAPGYASQTINSIAVTANNATVVNVQLNPNVPVANFSADHVSGCGGTVTFTDLTGSASGWLWNFGDGNTSTLQNPTHTYASGGNYTVTLSASNCTGSDNEIKTNYLNLTVTPNPVTTNDTASGCTPQSVTLGATGSGTLTWYDAASGGNLVYTGTTYNTPVLTNTTTYYVQNTSIGVAQHIGRDSTGATIQGSNFTGNQYLIFDALSDFTLISVYVNAQGAGNRTIELRNSLGTVIQSATVFIPAGQSRVTLNFNVPAGTNHQLGTSGTPNLWRNNAGSVYPYTISNVATITGNSAGLSGYYYMFYKWKVRQDCASALEPVTAVFNGGSVGVDADINSPSNTICAGETLVFTVTPTNAGATPSYQWMLNGNPVGTNSTTYTTSTLADNDLVTCVVTSSDPCVFNNPATSDSIVVNVFPIPSTPVIGFAAGDLSSSISSGNQWYFNNTLIPGATGATYTPTQNGDYYTIVTSNGCVSDTSNVMNITGIGITENEPVVINVFPNPADDVITVMLKGINGTADITLENMLGARVAQRTGVSNKLSVDVSGLSEGLYLLKVKTDKTRVYRVVVKHAGN